MHKKAFSLIELMIVVAIIGIIAMLSVPSFTRFLAKAKRAEAYVNLGSIYAAQKAYWAEHGRYSNVLNGEEGIGWKPEGYRPGEAPTHNYTYGFPGAQGKNFFEGKLGANGADLSSARADTNEFVAVAVGDIDGDGKFDILTVDDRNNIRIIQDDLID